MITLNDVTSISISPWCTESFYCQHRSTVKLHDGRIAHGLSSSEIYTIITNIALDKINPTPQWNDDDTFSEEDHSWNGQSIRKHFKDSQAQHESTETPEDVLNRIFRSA
jgi:hypothetical protein